MIKKTLILRITLLILTAVLLFFGFLVGVEIFTAEQQILPVMYVVAFVLWSNMILGLIIIYFLNKLLRLFESNEILSDRSLQIMNKIKNLTLTIAIITVGLMPFFITVGHLDDAPGFVLVGVGFIFIPFAVYVFISVLIEILSEAVAIKRENLEYREQSMVI